MNTPTKLIRRRQQRGATTLIVVMSLFLIVAMLAAFASRNMVYEQRIASNYYRAGVSFEAAEAGVEWTLAMLNSDNIDDACKSSAAGATDFRSRYLRVDAARAVSRAASHAGAVAACYLSDTGKWVCQCPAAGSSSALVMPVLSAETGLQPMFGVSLKSTNPATATAPGRAGTARVVVSGCSGLYTTCINPILSGPNSISKSDQAVDVALVSAVKMPPTSPLVARGRVTPGTPAALGLINSAPGSSGLLVQTGYPLAVDGLAKAESLPGNLASDNAITDDTVLRAQEVESFFASFFGMSSTYYSGQPKVRTIPVSSTCSTDCAGTLATRIAAGAQMFWLKGATTFKTDTDLGSPTNPVVIVFDGNLTISQPIRIYGLLYVRGNLSWTNSSGSFSVVTGAVVTEGDLEAAGTVSAVYDPTVMQILNNQRGSFVRVPGSAWDRGR